MWCTSDTPVCCGQSPRQCSLGWSERASTRLASVTPCTPIRSNAAIASTGSRSVHRIIFASWATASGIDSTVAAMTDSVVSWYCRLHSVSHRRFLPSGISFNRVSSTTMRSRLLRMAYAPLCTMFSRPPRICEHRPLRSQSPPGRRVSAMSQL